MNRQQWDKLRAEWRANRRLRLAALIALVFLAAHGLSALADQTGIHRKRYTSDLELQMRLEAVRGQDAWEERARQAEAALEATRLRVPDVTSAGLAQAELQTWLGSLGAVNGIAEPRVRVEETLDVPDHPDMWQVIGRLDGQIPQYGQGAFLRALSEGLPWIQAERIEIADGAQARFNVVVRAYYRRAAPGAGGGEPPASPQPQVAP